MIAKLESLKILIGLNWNLFPRESKEFSEKTANGNHRNIHQYLRTIKGLYVWYIFLFVLFYYSLNIDLFSDFYRY